MASKKHARRDRYLLVFLVRFVNLLPHRVALCLGAFLGRTLWAFSKRRVDKAEARCVSSLGVGVTSARRIIGASYVNLGRSVIEFIRLQKLKPHFDSLVSLEGTEYLDEALSRGRGVLLLTGHIGNWELCGARLTSAGYALAPIYTPQRNQSGLEDLIRRQRLETAGFDIVPSEGMGLREAFRVLRNGNILTFLQDLDARKEGIRVPFLGMPASTAGGIVRMHMKFGSPVVSAVAVRNPDARTHKVLIGEILSDLPDKEGQPFGSNMENSLEMCNNILGNWIRAYPEQWMWLLDRWESVLPFS